MPKRVLAKKKPTKKALDQKLAARIGRRIKKLRQSKGFTQEELGKLLGLEQGVISLFEQGKRCPCVPQLVRLAVALNGDLLEWLNLKKLNTNRNLP